MIDFIKDADCTKETPVRLGVPDAPIYGKGIKLKPRVDGRTDSEHFKKIYLPELLPLEEYDLIVVLISGGKDSVACYLKLLELGVPKERIEFWHHDIDGGHPSRRMDWKCTQNYVKALADAEGIKLRVSYRVNGFFGELYRIGASEPIEWIDPDDYAALRHDEEVLGFTLDNKKNLDEFIGDTQSCVCWKDKAAIHSILTGKFNTDDIYTNDWNYPVGAFHGADGGSC